MRAGELVLVDEAGMLDQDTARALLTVADEAGARVALLGDRHQLSAVGRGGVLDLAHRWADPAACLTLDVVHRFTRDTANPDGRTGTVPNAEYAALTVAMRAGEHPGEVFDALQAREIAHTCAQQARAARALLSSDTDGLRDSMLAAWDTQRDTVRGHAQTVHDGTGRFGQRAAAVTHARQELTSWAEAWRPTVPDLPTDTRRLADQLLWFENRPELYDTLDRVARRHAEHAHPDAVAALTTAESAAQTASTASTASTAYRLPPTAYRLPPTAYRLPPTSNCQYLWMSLVRPRSRRAA